MNSRLLRHLFSALLITILSVSSTALAAHSNSSNQKVATYSIESVFCSGCVAGIQSVVGEIEGVVSLDVDVENHKLVVVFEEDVTDAESLMLRISKETSFDLKMLSVENDNSDGL